VSVLLLDSMENIYKTAMRKELTSGNDGYKLFNTDWNYSFEKIEVEIIAPEEIELKATEENKEQTVTEKAELLDKLYQFGQEKIQSHDVFKVDGGEIVKKEKGHNISFTEMSFEQIEKEYISMNKEKYKVSDFIIPKLDLAKKREVFFITDDTTEINFEMLESSLNKDLLVYFNPEVADLFSKMISAMKLTTNDFYISSLLCEGSEKRDKLLSEINMIKPKLIITLGASATNLFMDNNERLKDVHGKFFAINLNEKNTYQLLPIFSPKLLLTATNMKKTAWKDMQKAMTFLDI